MEDDDNNLEYYIILLYKTTLSFSTIQLLRVQHKQSKPCRIEQFPSSWNNNHDFLDDLSWLNSQIT